MSALLDVIIPVFLIIGFGYCTVWARLFSIDTIDGLMKFSQNFAIPVLLFNAIAKVDLVNIFDFNLFLLCLIAAERLEIITHASDVLTALCII